MIDRLESILLKTPFLKHLYLKRSAKLKRSLCFLLERFGLLKPFTFVQWLATYNCNLHCPYCEASAGKPAEDELTTGEVKNLLDDLRRMGVKRFLILGGEPLLRPDLMEIMEYANQLHLKLGLVTNGFWVENHWKALQHFNYFLYFTSLDGLPEYSNRMRGHPKAFQKALRGLELFAALSVPVRIVNTVLHPGNIDQLEGLYEILKHSGANAWRLSPVARVGRATDNTVYSLTGKQLRSIADFIHSHTGNMKIEWGGSNTYLACFDGRSLGKPFFCGAGLTRCSVMPQGEVMACHQIFDLSFSEGTIREKPFSKIWKEKFFRFRHNSFSDSCQQCSYFSQCQGGCWAEMMKQGKCLKSVWGETS